MHTTTLATICSLIILVGLFQAQLAWSLARTIKLPLARATSLTSGQYGQPVISYYTKLDIGSPRKEFLIQFDINLQDSFVPHYSWSPFKVNLHYGKGFQCKASSTCKRENRELTINYQNCKLTGKVYEDMISFPSVREINDNNTLAANNYSSSVSVRAIPIFQQKFMAMSDASDARFKDLIVDGFVGLSPAPASSATGIQNLLITLHKANYIDNLQFSLWINPVLDSQLGGELVLGGVDESRYQGRIYWHPLADSVQPSDWSLALQQVTLANQQISCVNRSCKVVISSALNDIYGPPEDVAKIYSFLDSRRSNSLQLVDCARVSSFPYLTFHVDGIPYALLPSNYVRKTGDGKSCYLSIFATTTPGPQNRWLLGTNFLGAYHSTYDLTYKQVGFASLR